MKKIFNPKEVSKKVARFYELAVEARHTVTTIFASLKTFYSNATAYAPEIMLEDNPLSDIMDSLYDSIEDAEKELKELCDVLEKNYGEYHRTTLNNIKRLERRMKDGKSV